MSGFRSRNVVGKRIERCELNRFSDGRGGWTFNPVFILDDGTRLYFVVAETEVGEYGIDPYTVKA